MRSRDAAKQFVHGCDDRLIGFLQTLCTTQVHLIQQRRRVLNIDVFSQHLPRRRQAFFSTEHFEGANKHRQEQLCFAMEVPAFPAVDTRQSSFNTNFCNLRFHGKPVAGHRCCPILLVVEFGQSYPDCGRSVPRRHRRLGASSIRTCVCTLRLRS